MRQLKNSLQVILITVLLSFSTSAIAAPDKPERYCSVERRCAYIVIEAASGRVLESHAAGKRVFPASLTKLMTAYVLFEALNNREVALSDRVKVSKHAAAQPSLKLGLREGQMISLEDALEALSVRSANDAAVVIAEAISGSEDAFARRMTRRARAMGMSNTTFRNASGLPDSEQITTARDMALLAQRVVADFPRYRRYFGMTSAMAAGKEIDGHNNLVKSGALDGGKTGYIRDSGFNLVGWSTREGKLVIGAIFGGRNAAARDERLADLLDASFDSLKNRKNYNRRQRPEVAVSSPTPAQETIEDLLTAATAQTQEESEALAALTATPVRPAPTTLTPAKPVALAPALQAPPAGLTLDEKLTVLSDAPSPDQPAPSSMTFSQSWAVQVGAYRDEEQAFAALHQATRREPALLGAALPRTVPTTTAMGELFRAQLIGLDESGARTACDSLNRAGLQCLTMPPQKQSL